MNIVPWYWKLGALVLAVTALLAAGDAYKRHIESVADKAGYDRSEGEWRKREAGIAEAARQHAEAGAKQARDETDALQEKFNAMADTRQKEKAQHEQDKRTAIAAALAGTERLRIPTNPAANCAVREAGNGQDASTGTGVAPTSSADLLPQTAADILDIATDYGQLVRDYNTVVDRYADATRACNASPVTTQPPTGE